MSVYRALDERSVTVGSHNYAPRSTRFDSTLRTHCNNRWNIKRRKMLKSLQNVRNSLKCLKCLTSLLFSSLVFSSFLCFFSFFFSHFSGIVQWIWRQSAAIGLNATAGKVVACVVRKPIMLPGCISESLHGSLGNRIGFPSKALAINLLQNLSKPSLGSLNSNLILEIF